jgi:hypothetical protein
VKKERWRKEERRRKKDEGRMEGEGRKGGREVHNFLHAMLVVWMLPQCCSAQHSAIQCQCTVQPKKKKYRKKNHTMYTNRG